MRLYNRPQRLQQKMPDPSCLSCRDRRGRSVLVEAERQADCSVVLRNHEPEACAQSGFVPQNVVKVLLSVVESPSRQD